MDSIFTHVREVSILLLIILSQASLSNSWDEPAVPRAARWCVVLGVQTQLVCLEIVPLCPKKYLLASEEVNKKHMAESRAMQIVLF